MNVNPYASALPSRATANDNCAMILADRLARTGQQLIALLAVTELLSPLLCFFVGYIDMMSVTVLFGLTIGVVLLALPVCFWTHLTLRELRNALRCRGYGFDTPTCACVSLLEPFRRRVRSARAILSAIVGMCVVCVAYVSRIADESADEVVWAAFATPFVVAGVALFIQWFIQKTVRDVISVIAPEEPIREDGQK